MSAAVSFDHAVIDNRPPTMAAAFTERVRTSGSREAYRYPDGDGWTSVTWARPASASRGWPPVSSRSGCRAEQRVGVASGTRYEWILADLAIMCAGAATTTVYPSTIPDDVAYILADSECQVVFAEDDEQVAKLTAHRTELPHLKKVVTFEETAGHDDWVISLVELERLGEQLLGENPSAVAESIAAIDPLRLATLIYTSGTTGRPKGVRLRHSSWTYEGAAIEAQGILSEDDLQFLWLPMAHSFGKVLLSTQLAIGFATAVDGRVDKIIENLAVVKPTFMGAAPRIFEKAHGRIVTMQAKEGGAKEKIFKQAFKVGLERRPAQARGQVGAPAPQGAARRVRQARVRQGARALRRAGALLHLRCRRAQPRGRGVVPRRRHRDPRGLRPHRDQPPAPS